MPEPASNSSPVQRDPDTVSSTMLEQLRAQDPEAWRRLVKLLGPLVYEWCHHHFRLQPSDADDIVQDVFRTVSTALGGFHRDKPGDTFRGWVWTITRSKVCNYLRAKKKQALAFGGTDANQQWEQLRDDGSLAVDEPSPAEGDRSIVSRALDSIRNDFTDTTWRAFLGTAIDGRSSNDVAEELGISPAAVRQAKARVLRRLRQEVEGLLRVQSGECQADTS